MKELGRLLPYLAQYKIRLLLGFFFVSLSNICSTTIPRVVGRTIDVIKTANFSTLDIAELLGYILLLTAGSGFFMFLTRKTIIVASRLVEYDVRRDFLSAVDRQSLRYFHSTSTGSLMAHATNDIAAIREFVGPAVMYSANTLTTFLFAISYMLRIDPWITAFTLIPLPFVGLATYRIGKKVHVLFRNVQEEFGQLTTHAQESFSGVRVIRAYARERYEAEKFTGISKAYFDKNIRLAKAQSLTMPAVMVLIGMSQLIVLGYGGYRVIHGQSTLGEITQFFIYINQLIWPVAAIGWVTNIIQRAAASSGRIGRILDLDTSIKSPAGSDGHTIGGEIEFRNVSFRYSDSSPIVLEDIYFKISAGSSLGIVGSVGSGKSSLIGLLPRLHDVSEGSILLDGRDIREMDLNELRSSIGIVPQESFLFSMSIEENIRFGKADASREDIHRAAAISQLADEVERFPEGYQTIVGERGITLSGGQKQRTAIARAIIRSPKILILDDSLSAVDTSTEEKILQGLNEVLKDRTTIIISHRISSVKNADSIIVLDEGRIVEMGSHQELLRKGGLYAEMHSLQQLQEEIEHYDEKTI